MTKHICCLFTYLFNHLCTCLGNLLVFASVVHCLSYLHQLTTLSVQVDYQVAFHLKSRAFEMPRPKIYVRNISIFMYVKIYFGIFFFSTIKIVIKKSRLPPTLLDRCDLSWCIGLNQPLYLLHQNANEEQIIH